MEPPDLTGGHALCRKHHKDRGQKFQNPKGFHSAKIPQMQKYQCR